MSPLRQKLALAGITSRPKKSSDELIALDQLENNIYTGPDPDK